MRKNVKKLLLTSFLLLSLGLLVACRTIGRNFIA